LRSARQYNPSKRIILLGDETNRRFVPPNVEYLPLDELSGGRKEKEFQKVFQLIQGTNHQFNKEGGVDFWLKFVFRRWFFMEEFLIRQGIDAFWTFDSDTLILSDLFDIESIYKQLNIDSTTQCGGRCLNGWVGSRKLVSEYTQSILYQFNEPSYLALQRERLKNETGLAFNEMDAFSEYCRRSAVKTHHGEIPVESEILDDALAFTGGFEMAQEMVLGKTAIKRLWSDGRGIYARHLGSGKHARLLTCNMSWMPDYMWRTIKAAASWQNTTPKKLILTEGTVGAEARTDLREISIKEPILDQILREIKRLFWDLRKRICTMR
jgi:hypothetical protein